MGVWGGGGAGGGGGVYVSWKVGSYEDWIENLMKVAKKRWSALKFWPVCNLPNDGKV